MAGATDISLLKHLNIDQAVIDRDAAAILHSATQAAGKILARRQEMDAQGLKNKPLVVLSGEEHTVTSQSLHLLLLLKGLKTSEPGTVLAYELEHNFDHVMRKFMKKDFSALSREGKSEWQLGAFLSFYKSLFSGAAKKALYNYALKEKILFSPTDAAARRGSLDRTDPSTQRSIKACEPRPRFWLQKLFMQAASLKETDPHGMYIRNHHMVEHGLRFANEAKARIMVQHCGDYHIGLKKRPFFSERPPYKQSLTALFKKKGFDPFTIHESKEADHNLAGLPKKFARYDFAALCGMARSDFDTEEEEKIYIDAILSRTGFAQYRYNGQAQKRTKKTIGRFM